jgi:phage FluMu protein Com
MSGCTHKTLSAHTERVDPGGQRWWRCSMCPHVGLWSEGFTYLGTIECKKCGFAEMDEVRCAECSKGVATCDAKPKAKSKRPRPDVAVPVTEVEAGIMRAAINHARSSTSNTRDALKELCREYLAVEGSDG